MKKKRTPVPRSKLTKTSLPWFLEATKEHEQTIPALIPDPDPDTNHTPALEIRPDDEQLPLLTPLSNSAPTPNPTPDPTKLITVTQDSIATVTLDSNWHLDFSFRENPWDTDQIISYPVWSIDDPVARPFYAIYNEVANERNWMVR